MEMHLLQLMRFMNLIVDFTLVLYQITFTTSDTVGIDTGGLVFKCSKDNFF